MKLFDAASATSNANTAGLPFTATAMFTASGTITTVAPTFEITIVKNVVSSTTASSSCHALGCPSARKSSCAIHAPAPVESTAQPSGIKHAIKKIERQLIDWYASSIDSTPVSSMPN